MKKSFDKLVQGYHKFREQYAVGDNSVMERLAYNGQQPEVMVIGCADSRVDPALVLQCEPGDLFVVRNVGNIVPPYEKDEKHHGTSAALEFGICSLQVKHLIILGHTQCGGMQALITGAGLNQNDFISRWVSIIDVDTNKDTDSDELSKKALLCSYENCLTFPWIKQRVEAGKLSIHLWSFDVKEGEIFAYSFEDCIYKKLN